MSTEHRNSRRTFNCIETGRPGRMEYPPQLSQYGGNGNYELNFGYWGYVKSVAAIVSMAMFDAIGGT